MLNTLVYGSIYGIESWVEKSWQNFEEQDRRSLDCLEHTVSRNMDVKVSAGEGSEGSEEHSRENLCHLREDLNSPNSLLVDVWMLKALLLWALRRTWKTHVT